MKVALIRCLQTEDMCPATTCLKVMKEHKLAFEGIQEEIEVIAFNTCGGCPGKKAIPRAAEMVKRGAEAIVMASCIFRGTPIGYPCPHAQAMKDAIVKKIGPNVKIFDYTH